VVSTAFIRDFLIGEADIASFSCYSKPHASAGGAFTLAEVLSRIFLERSLQVTDEYTGYLMAVSSFLWLGHVQGTKGHIRMDLIDLLRTKFPALIRACRIFAYSLSIIFAGYLTCVGWRLFYQSYSFGSKSMQISETPLALPQIFIPLGAAALLLQYICDLYTYCSGQSDR
jgi:TRAP-type C4-dicarboxylate transport system permease small subunit